MTAGDIGGLLIINAGGYNLIGATCTLLAAPGHGTTQGQAIALSPVIIASDGYTATYTQTGKDFTSGGFWKLQLQVITADGQMLYSESRELYIYPKISG